MAAMAGRHLPEARLAVQAAVLAEQTMRLDIRAAAQVGERD